MYSVDTFEHSLFSAMSVLLHCIIIIIITSRCTRWEEIISVSDLYET